MSEFTQVVDAAQKLADKLGEIHRNPSYEAVWDLFYAHGHKYNGPDYKNELKELQELLNRIRQGGA